MSGALIAASAAGGTFSALVTIANLASNQYGFSSGGGAISPTSYRGQTFVNVSSDGTGGTGNSFNIALLGVLAQSFFRAVVVQRTTGVWVRFTSASATAFVSGPANTIWQWGSGAPDAVWTNTSPSPRSIIFEIN